MKSTINGVSALVALATVLCLSVTASARVSKIVILARVGDVIRNSLPSATNYFVKTVTVGQTYLAEIKAQRNFSPDMSHLKFFYGEDASGRVVGTVIFDKIETADGPIEVGIAFTPGGVISNAVVTRATAETEPWIKDAIGLGLMKHLIGINAESAGNPLENVSESEYGAMPYYMAQVISTAVTRAAVYYGILCRPNLPK